MIYSKFSGQLTDISYIVRSAWIVVAGFVLIVINAHESDSGFSGELSVEGQIIYLTIAVYFFVNYLLRSFKRVKVWFAVLMVGCFLSSCWLSYIAISDFHYLVYSSFGLVAYSLGLMVLMIILERVKTVSQR